MINILNFFKLFLMLGVTFDVEVRSIMLLKIRQGLIELFLVLFQILAVWVSGLLIPSSQTLTVLVISLFQSVSLLLSVQMEEKVETHPGTDLVL
jgi:hypothetical protein